MGGSARALCVALALATLSVLLVRPFCDILLATSGNAGTALTAAHEADGHAHTRHGSDPSGTCCSSLGAGAPLAPSWLIPTAGGGGLQLALVAGLSVFLRSRFLTLGAPRLAGAPPRSRPYHARSARIQR